MYTSMFVKVYKTIIVIKEMEMEKIKKPIKQT